MKNAQLGIILAAFLKILPPFLFLLPGILCFVLHPELDDPDKAFATMVVHHLPSGMVGLIVAVLIAALISTLDSGLNSFSTIFTLDIYQKNLRPSATPQEIKWIGRLTTAVVSVIAVGCALMMESFERGLFDTLQSIIAFIAPPVAAVFLMGILWRGATSTAALVALWIGSLASISLGFCHLNGWPTSSYWPHYLLMSFYVFAGICLLILVVSLVTEKDESLQPLPSLKQLVLLPETQKRTVWVLWGLLAAIMGGIYILFS